MANADNENYDTAIECYKCTENLTYKSKAHDPDGKYVGACCLQKFLIIVISQVNFVDPLTVLAIYNCA